MKKQRIHLTSYFGFSKIPFTKYMWATKMFDASAQRDLINGLHLWLETRCYLPRYHGGKGRCIYKVL